MGATKQTKNRNNNKTINYFATKRNDILYMNVLDF